MMDEMIDWTLPTAVSSLPKELGKESLFRFDVDRRRYLITRALVRTVLSRYAPRAPEWWQFKTNYYGRPEILSANSWISDISFNIAHSNSLVVVGHHREK
jgi:4'-phosphopantetheinyl transferase